MYNKVLFMRKNLTLPKAHWEFVQLFFKMFKCSCYSIMWKHSFEDFIESIHHFWFNPVYVCDFVPSLCLYDSSSRLICMHSVCLSFCLSVCLSVCSVCLSICLLSTQLIRKGTINYLLLFARYFHFNFSSSEKNVEKMWKI